MADTEEEHLDLDGSADSAAPPATMQKRAPARAMIAVIVVLAVVAIVAVVMLIPNGGTTP